MQSERKPQAQIDQHAVWMENAGFLYDRLLIQKLKWPSLTFQWLPFRQESSSETLYHCLYGTHSSGAAQTEHLYISEVSFPVLREIDADPKDLQASRMRAIYRFTHEAEINKARHSPHESGLIAARTDEGPICLFKYGNEYPVTLFEASLNGGFALQWSRDGILSGDFSGKAYFWSNPEASVQEVSFGSEVQDVKMVEDGLAAIVGDSGLLSFWDLRTNSIVQTVSASNTEKKQLYSVAVNPVQRQLLITGGEDESIRIWDRRNLSAQLHMFQGHQGKVMNLEWSSVNSSIFASGATDKKVKIWDLMRVGFEIPKDLGGTDELLFTHEGHKGAINDLGWNPHEMIIGSAQEDENTLQFYQIVRSLLRQTNNIHELEYAEDVEFLREQCFS